MKYDDTDGLWPGLGSSEQQQNLLAARRSITTWMAYGQDSVAPSSNEDDTPLNTSQAKLKKLRRRGAAPTAARVKVLAMMVTYGDQLVKSVLLKLELSVGPAQRWAWGRHQEHMSLDETSGSRQVGSATTVNDLKEDVAEESQNRPQGEDVAEERRIRRCSCQKLPWQQRLQMVPRLQSTRPQ
jgi:hypothetical protein